MKTLRTYIIAAALGACFAATGCKEENNLHPWGENQLVDDLGVVTVTGTQSTPGGAVINYELPDSKDLLYVKAVYTVGQNTRMETRASKYDHSVTLQGFGDTQPRDVDIYCVDRMENVGQKVTASITPGTPPIVTVFESLDAGPAFGGIYVDFVNAAKGDIAIHVETTDAENFYYEAYTHYTSSLGGRFFLRELTPISKPFNIYVTDRWGNKSDVFTEYYTPIPEYRLDKSKFQVYKLPTDISCDAWGGSLAYAWNDDFTPALFVHSPGGDTFPMWFTFDIGQEAQLSRYKFYHLFMEQHAFQRGNLKTWEVWGRADTPPADGSWDGWIKLLDCESYKPSGLPVGEISGEDWEYLQAGEDFEFRPDLPSVRYIRFKVLETWGGDDFIHFTEFTFWGNPK